MYHSARFGFYYNWLNKMFMILEVLNVMICGFVEGRKRTRRLID